MTEARSSSAPSSDDGVQREWGAFLSLLEVLLNDWRGTFLRPHRVHLEEWHRNVLKDLQSPEAQDAFLSGWSGTFAEPHPYSTLEQWHRAEDRLRDEIRAVTLLLASVTGREELLPRGLREVMNQRTKRRTILGSLWRILNKPIGLKEAGGAGSTLLGSVGDLLDGLPAWIKALVKIGKEAVDIAFGGRGG